MTVLIPFHVLAIHSLSISLSVLINLSRSLLLMISLYISLFSLPFSHVRAGLFWVIYTFVHCR